MALDIRLSADTPTVLLKQHAFGVPVTADGKGPKLPPLVRQLLQPVADAVTAAVRSGGFAAKVGETMLVPTPVGMVMLVGTGKKPADPEAQRRAYGALVQAAGKAKIARVAVPVLPGRNVTVATEAAVVGAALGNYRFLDYRSKSTRDSVSPTIDTLVFWEPDGKRGKAIQRGISSGRVIAEAVCRVRDLVNTPANDLPPKTYAEIAAQWCAEAGVKLQILGPKEIARAGMGAVMAVGAGSANESRFLVATYLGRKRQPKSVDAALVGKGVTFDTGGISIKPAADMWEMRGDMMGSAVMLASICAAAKLKLPTNLIALTPLVENMPSGTAYRPGDVVRTLSGQTIEIISTDAEGRLILADALTYAQRFNPKIIVDCATLTGAIVVALGDVCCGIFTEKEDLWRGIQRASDAAGEKVWRMPLYAEYDEKIKSDIADMKNSGGREGGASTAARLLRKFTGDFPWVHIDIAGVDLEKKGHHYCPKGASGFGARLVIEFLRGR